MSRILLLLVVVFWLSRPTGQSLGLHLAPSTATSIFLAGFGLIALVMSVWSQQLVSAVRRGTLHRTLFQFQRSMTVARAMIPAWFAVGVFGLDWGNCVNHLLGPIAHWPIELPAMIVGTAPAIIAWLLLTCAYYPADRSLREQTLFYYLDADLPIHAPPGFAAYFSSTLRLQILFTLVPIMLILLLRDSATVALSYWLGPATPGSASATMLELAPMLTAIAAVVILIPEILRRILSTERLPDSPLRERLDALCKRTGLRYRDILLWKTNHYMGNAAVMGLIPQLRFILLSDVLLETMTDQQIEAVFAHELGHVKHWHLGWYIVLVKTMVLLSLGPGQFILGLLMRGPHPRWLTPDVVDIFGSMAGFVGFIAAFGFVSRWFERQADLFAARTMQQQEATGAATFSSALHRVAIVNNIPVSARNFTHGSIEQRMNVLQRMVADPTQASEFDRMMRWVNWLLIAALIIGGAWVAIAAFS